METSTEIKSGLYWVKFGTEPEWTIAKYSSENESWLVIGSEIPYYNNEFDKIDYKIISRSEKLSDIEIMRIMASSNLDIKATTNFHESRSVRAGGVIGFGVDKATLAQVNKSFGLGTQDYYAIAFIVNREQFDKIQNEHKS